MCLCELNTLNISSSQTLNWTSLFGNSLFLYCSFASTKQLLKEEGKRKQWVTVVWLWPHSLGSGAGAPECCVVSAFLYGGAKRWIWSCALLDLDLKQDSLLSLLSFFPSQSRVAGNDQNAWLLPLPSVSHTLLWSSQLLPGQASYCLGTRHTFLWCVLCLCSCLHSVKENSFCSLNGKKPKKTSCCGFLDSLCLSATGCHCFKTFKVWGFFPPKSWYLHLTWCKYVFNSWK